MASENQSHLNDLIQEVTTLLTDCKEEGEMILDRKATWEEEDTRYRKMQEDIKIEIERLLSVNNNWNEKISGDANPDKIDDSTLQEELKHVQEDKKVASKKFQDVSSSLKQAQEELEHIRIETEKIKSQIRDDIPTIVGKMKLYELMTQVKWTTSDTTDTTKGYVTEKGDIKPFSLDTKQNSQFFISNHIWDLMTPNW
ncbi:PREDICTED: kinetochore protein Spc24-like [Priapulus caudatus]|uniref:Kinetochore protein Spc24 n=1 Tax=Priapulus caudatus TaxID=37621 RepID=A0ABM1E7K3_PRICU|nr:PREDICTED: kinetochore protein Spc24-like [Priapulus caudatus]